GPATFPYTVCDNLGLCTEATLHFLVGIDNSTDAVNDETSTWQDVNVSGGVIANDYDAENNTQTFSNFLAQGATPGAPISSGATLSGVNKSGGAVANAGVLTFAADGTYTFDPDPAFTGTISVPYRLCDNGNLSKCDTAYLLITVDPLPTTGINSVIANNDENVSYGSPVGGSLFVNDRDPQANAFTVTSFVGGTVGTPGIVAGIDLNGNPVANAGTLTINADGTYTYTPAPGFVGSINISYTITDNNVSQASSTAILHIDVLKDPNELRNDPPFAGDDFGYTTINKPVLGNFISNDSDPNGDPVSYLGITIVPAGPATPIGGLVATAQGGTLQFYANGTYLYTPPTGYVGPDLVNYQICDVTVVAPQPLCSDATIHLLVGPGINITGKVWVDANGNVIDAGTGEPETNIGGTLYVNLLDASNNVIATTPVANDGSYNFNNINPGSTYTLQLSLNQGTVAQPAPSTLLPANWVHTGETRNGTIDGGSFGQIDARTYGFTNVINYDFGIEQLPQTNARTQIVSPTGSGEITSGSVTTAVLGSDPEDGVLGNSNTIVITSLPSNATMFYNGVAVTVNQNISGFDPALLSFTGITLGTSAVVFEYAFLDAASQQDPSPATYELRWGTPLPVTGLEVRAILNGSNNVSVDWKTETEVNSSHFIVERSTDNITFTAIGKVGAAGSSSTTKYYNYNDDISALQSYKLLYYRIRQVDMDGKAALSNIATVRKNLNIQISAYPNPFVSDVMVTIYSQLSGTIDMRITDVTGRTVLQQKSVLYRGSNQVPVNKLANLPGGTYLLEVLNNADNRATTLKLIKQ
ncbi:MAG TPA: Ig-like domain-containing protein, partial [Lacibacter sp.]|nr:Ig-like domain-containing protein [Lacibacter sp.]